MEFWRKDRVETLRNALKITIDDLNISTRDLEIASDSAYKPLSPVSISGTIPAQTKELKVELCHHKTIHLFKTGKTQKPHGRTLSKILIVLIKEIRAATDKNERNTLGLAPFNDLISEYSNFLENTKNNNTRRRHENENENENSERVHPRSNKEIADTAHVLFSFLKLGRNASSSIETVYFSDGDPREIYFDTFRFCSKIGTIQKSFTVLHRASKGIPVVRFTNYFEYDSRTRKSAGIALKFNTQVAFIGQSDNGDTIKILVFDKATTPQNTYNGLLLSSEPDGGSISARFVMRRSKFKTHMPAGTGVKMVKDYYDDAKLISALRNRVDFGLEEEVHDSFGEPVTERDMVSLTDRQLRMEDGTKLLTDENGRLFNPSDHGRYTFNSALKIKD